MNVQVGELRTKEDTLSELESQLEKVLDAAPSTALTMASSSGVKDKFFLHFFEQLQEMCRKLKGDDDASHSKEEIVKVLQGLRSKMPSEKSIFNPALSISGMFSASRTCFTADCMHRS
jgi:hypothetical protein